MLGLFSVAQAFGLLLLGLEVLSNPAWQAWFALADRAHLQTAVFLQLVVGGHLLLFVTRSERWFFLPPFPAWPLLGAAWAAQHAASPGRNKSCCPIAHGHFSVLTQAPTPLK